ncbi:MAG: phosphomannose isomerase type II C-terminal cupin domain [Hyphomicrobiales bacterium]
MEQWQKDRALTRYHDFGLDETPSPLDEGASGAEWRACRSVKEVREYSVFTAQGPPPGSPILTWTQPALRVNKPWGHYRNVHRNDGVRIKEIVVNPEDRLSLQHHRHRSEHWVVVQGCGLVTCGLETTIIGRHAAIVIPCGVVHRLANPGAVPLYLIEIQLGDYLEEDDIIRLSDDYGRLVTL